MRIPKHIKYLLKNPCRDAKYLEETLKCYLPRDYLEMLLKYHLETTCLDSYPIIESRYEDGSAHDADGVTKFYSISRSTNDDYSIYQNLEIYRNRTPKEMLPIAEAPGSNLICLGIEGEYYGKVYYWDHNWESDDDESPAYDNIYLIANSFTDFINSLYKTDIELEGSRIKKLISIYDKIALPYSHYVKKFGDIITNFFAQAPKSTEDFIIEEMEQTDDIYLKYEDKESKKRHIRHIKKSGELIGDSIEDIK